MSTHTTLDLLLVAIVLASAFTGFRHGLVVGLFGTAGLLAGVFAGMFLAPLATGRSENATVWVSLLAVTIVVTLGFLGQGMAQFLGGQVRDRLAWKPARLADALAGMGLSAVTSIAVIWVLSGAVVGGLIPTGGSKVITSVSSLTDAQAARAFGTIDDNVFTDRYVDPFLPERILDVPAPNQAIVEDRDVLAAKDSILKIRGAKSCGGASEGTGFVYAPGRMMTNAHVVDDMSRPEIIMGNHIVPAVVVAYSEDLDLAVLAFDDTTITPLVFDLGGRALDDVVVAGYPEDGPFDMQAGRIRSEDSMRGESADGTGTRVRDTFTLRALVRHGNSGGPVLNADGKVVAVVFATDTSGLAEKGDETGYAITAEAAAQFGADALGASKAINTNLC
jgi:S1-C subfamily serine protease